MAQPLPADDAVPVAARGARPGRAGAGAHAGIGRAAPMPPDQRRAAIVAAALPLVAEHGADVTSRQIAHAAGIAEGTIFRVFPDKDAVIKAVVHDAFDPAADLDLIAAIDLGRPLEQRVTDLVDIVRSRLARVWQLMNALRMFGAPEENQGHRYRPALPSPTQEMDQAMSRVLAVRPDELRIDPVKAARVLRLLIFTGSHPRITDENPLTTAEIVSIVLDGLRAHAP